MSPRNTLNTCLSLITNSSRKGRECPRIMRTPWPLKSTVEWMRPRPPIKLQRLRLLQPLLPPELTPLRRLPPRL